MFFVHLSFKSDLNGKCLTRRLTTVRHVCHSTVFNNHNCNNIVHCSETLVRYKRCSTVCAVMDKIPPFYTIKRTEPSGWALCSMLSWWQTPCRSQSCKWLRYKHQSNIYLFEMELMCMSSPRLQGFSRTTSVTEQMGLLSQALSIIEEVAWDIQCKGIYLH